MLLLVFADGDRGGFGDEDVGCHEGGISEQACIDVVGVLAHHVFDLSAAFHLPGVVVHVDEEVEFDGFMKVALQIYGGFLRVEAASKVLD